MKEKVAEIINIIFGFRKFLLMLVIYIVGILFRLKGLISGGEMVDLFKATTIAFMGANGVEHIVTAVKEYNAGKSQPANQDDNLVPTDDNAGEGKG